jgi:hypothetical protein
MHWPCLSAQFSYFRRLVSHALGLTCLGLVDPPGEEASLGDRLGGLVVRLTAEETATAELVGGCDAQ